MKKYLKTVAVWTALVSVIACTEETTLKAHLGKERLVIDGVIELDRETNETTVLVKVSTTVAYFDDTNPQQMGGVVATLYDESGADYQLHESSPGIYTTDQLEAAVDQTYSLEIIWNDEIYISESKLLSVPELQDVYQITQEATFFDDAGIKLAVDFQDPSGIDNFYHFEQYRNDTLLLTPSNGNQFQLVVKDEFFDGQFIESYVPGDEFSFLPGDLGSIKMRSLDEKAFSFYKLFYEKSVDEPSFIVGETPPVAIKGNITNISDPDNYGLGYFLATNVTVRSTNIIEEE